MILTPVKLKRLISLCSSHSHPIQTEWMCLWHESHAFTHHTPDYLRFASGAHSLRHFWHIQMWTELFLSLLCASGRAHRDTESHRDEGMCWASGCWTHLWMAHLRADRNIYLNLRHVKFGIARTHTQLSAMSKLCKHHWDVCYLNFEYCDGIAHTNALGLHAVYMSILDTARARPIGCCFSSRFIFCFFFLFFFPRFSLRK